MGPLTGLKVLEFAGIGPVPMCAMLLADLGADVLRVDRVEPVDLGIARAQRHKPTLRSRKAVALDLKEAASLQTVRRLIQRTDVLLEGFRPGVMERLGLGPDTCIESNARLIYGRMTGWGQDGPLAHAAGHDLNYIALTGALHAIGRAGGPPAPPLNLVGDFAGGSLYLAFGVMAAVFERTMSGKGQIIDAAIVDGTASLMTFMHGLVAAGQLSTERGTNVVDGGAPFYDVYQSSDGLWISIAAIEKKFYAELLRLIEIDPASMPAQHDRDRWPEQRERLARRFAEKTRDEWCAILEGTDACFAPVLTVEEAASHHHMAKRGTYGSVDGLVQPQPAPRFSRTPGRVSMPPEEANPDVQDQVLADWLA